jgi:hypothetical protein
MTGAVLRLVVFGKPRTKKNHGTVVQRGKHRFHIPSAAWTEWVRTANIEVADPGDADAHLPVEVPVNCRAIFYRDAHRGDAVGYYQGLADLLEKRKIVVNDVLIVSWDGSRLAKDADRPRVEIELTPAKDPNSCWEWMPGAGQEP